MFTDERFLKDGMSEPTRRGLLVGSCLLAMAGLAGCSSPVARAPTPGQPSFYRNLAEAGAEVDAPMAASMISGFRANNGRAGLSLDSVLMQVAQAQARAMAAADDVGVRTGGVATRLANSRYGFRTALETTSAGYLTLAEAFSGWRDSPPHRANMLDQRVTRMGIATGFRPGSKYRVFWALVLTEPMALA